MEEMSISQHKNGRYFHGVIVIKPPSSAIEDISTLDLWTFLPLSIGMTEKTITDLINEWKPRKSLADEIGATVEQVHKWAKFGRIPAEWQYRVLCAAQVKGLEWCTAEWMTRTHHAAAA